MSPCIPHHMFHAPQLYLRVVSITALLSAMLILLYSSTNQELFKKYV